MKKWISFISQTGSEIGSLASKHPEYEVTVVTNHPEKIKEECKKYFKHIITIPVKPSLEDYYNLHLEQYDLITLNGFLRIVPAEIADKYLIYNGHPGLITVYPELKGKDPQQRAWEGNYKTIGSVVHRVVGGVDEGEVVEEESIDLFPNEIYTLDDYFSILRMTSEKCWDKFLSKI